MMKMMTIWCWIELLWYPLLNLTLMEMKVVDTPDVDVDNVVFVVCPDHVDVDDGCFEDGSTMMTMNRDGDPLDPH
jgi:hypothetical protein